MLIPFPFPNPCPIEVTINLISSKWKILILRNLFLSNTLSYTEFKKGISGISQKMLTQQLKELERDRLISKTVYKESIIRTEYELTILGKNLEPVLESMLHWGEQYLSQ